MNKDLSHITQTERDALQIMDTFISAIARAGIYSVEARLLAAEAIMASYLTGISALERDVINAFVKLLREGDLDL